ncbi:MAG: hypothetical protein ACKVS6_04780 [Planctomycetota bacterium]
MAFANKTAIGRRRLGVLAAAGLGSAVIVYLLFQSDAININRNASNGINETMGTAYVNEPRGATPTHATVTPDRSVVNEPPQSTTLQDTTHSSNINYQPPSREENDLVAGKPLDDLSWLTGNDYWNPSRNQLTPEQEANLKKLIKERRSDYDELGRSITKKTIDIVQALHSSGKLNDRLKLLPPPGILRQGLIGIGKTDVHVYITPVHFPEMTDSILSVDGVAKSLAFEVKSFLSNPSGYIK